MKISDVALQVGLTPKAIRLYEAEGLIQPRRTASGYRRFTQSDLQDLNFLAHARAMGFSLKECSDLMKLYKDSGRASADVKSLAAKKLEDLDAQLTRLKTLRFSLKSWIDHCPGDASPACPIIQRLANDDQMTD